MIVITPKLKDLVRGLFFALKNRKKLKWPWPLI